MTQIETPSAPVREQIVAQLREAIASGRLVSGQRLVERELTDQSGASRTAVREALRQLETQGLIRRSGPGLVVAGVTADEAEEIYEIRAALEGLAAARCAKRANPAVHDALKETRAWYVEALDSGDIDGALAAKEALYEEIYTGADAHVLSGLMRTLNARVTHLRSASLHKPGRGPRSAEEIVRLVDAIIAGDSKAAREAAAAHVVAAAAGVLASPLTGDAIVDRSDRNASHSN